MPKSALIDAIRDAYCVKNPSASVELVDHFCAFAVEWLAQPECAIIGVGMTDSGMALKRADGSEISLLQPDAASVMVGGAVSISGPSGGVRSGGSLESPSVTISGQRS